MDGSGDQAGDSRVTVTELPFFPRSQLPFWYKSGLFNVLYFVMDGGTIWLELPPDCLPQDLQGPGRGRGEGGSLSHFLPVLWEYGRFAYLEGNS